MDSDEHEITREARRIGAAMLAVYKPGKVGAGLAALARTYGISAQRVELVMKRARELQMRGDPAFSHRTKVMNECFCAHET
ncbi:hypothetical protein PQQ53_21370 [Paraburkholderia strydomiana]|uniref:hypothetical protein n=1 Tax=Paraburkholderia strydomiana TaxID=1245417 RepID=UPI0038B85B94